jgi:hypothetical protein
LLTKENTKGNYVRAENYAVKMKAAGARVIRVERDQAFPQLVKLLQEGDVE